MLQQGDEAWRAHAGLRSSPTGRVPQWVLDEAVGRVAAPDAWRNWSPAEPPRAARRRRSWGRAGGTLLGIAVVVLGSAAIHLHWLPGANRLPAPAAAGAVPAGGPAAPNWPTPGFESAGQPLGTAVAAIPADGAYDFVEVQSDGVTPVAYDPCRPIHYVVREDNAPYGGDRLVQSAVARVSEVTGLQFIFDGVTDEGPSDQRQAFQPDRYGDRWAPVLVTWDTVTEQPGLADAVMGLGGSLAVSRDDGPSVFVTGAVALDAAQFTDVLTDPDGAAVARAVVLHEFGHVVGLGHVDDPSQLMYPTTTDVYDFADGDLAGLAQLGAGACVPSL